MITIKIGRHEYDITETDVFMDNDACVQLITQINERQGPPVLSARVVKEISIFNRNVIDGYGGFTSVTCFGLGGLK